MVFAQPRRVPEFNVNSARCPEFSRSESSRHKQWLLGPIWQNGNVPLCGASPSCHLLLAERFFFSTSQEVFLPMSFGLPPPNFGNGANTWGKLRNSGGNDCPQVESRPEATRLENSFFWVTYLQIRWPEWHPQTTTPYLNQIEGMASRWVCSCKDLKTLTSRRRISR